MILIKFKPLFFLSKKSQNSGYLGGGGGVRIALYLHEIMIRQVPVYIKGFPGGSAGQESACNAGDLGSIPGLRKIPHVAEQWSPCATTSEPRCLEPVLLNKRSHCN